MNVVWGLIVVAAASGEGAIVQGVLIGSVMSVITVLMLQLQGLNSPFHGGVGGLQPVAMERSLRMADEALSSAGAQVELQCDALGKPVARMTTPSLTAAGSSSWRPYSCPSRPSRRRGAATSRPGGTVSRRRRAGGQTRCGSSRRRI
jgi:hypothetical protein